MATLAVWWPSRGAWCFFWLLGVSFDCWESYILILSNRKLLQTLRKINVLSTEVFASNQIKEKWKNQISKPILLNSDSASSSFPQWQDVFWKRVYKAQAALAAPHWIVSSPLLFTSAPDPAKDTHSISQLLWLACCTLQGVCAGNSREFLFSSHQLSYFLSSASSHIVTDPTRISCCW